MKASGLKLTTATIAMVVASQILINHSAHGEDEHLGLTEYEIACMPCHGIEGRGDGPMVEKLQTRPSDLTGIAKANGGTFPTRAITEVIDGRASVADHLGREMPIWGERYRKATAPDEKANLIDQRARNRIDALVEYLRGIQQD